MLSTQVQYWSMMESHRHNVETEALSAREIAAKEYHNQIDWFNAQETQRHNVVNEHVAWANLQETNRHNVETESIGWGNLNETIRHNQETEQIGWSQARSAQTQAAASMLQANAAQRNASTNFMSYVTERDLTHAKIGLTNAQTNTESYRQFQLQQSGNKDLADATYAGSYLKMGWYNTLFSNLSNTIGNVGKIATIGRKR